MDRFETCLAFTLKSEGGFVNNPNDPGGATNRGVTQRVYDAYRGKNNLDPRGVEFISDDEVENIYRSEYWEPCCCDLLAEGVDLCVFDFAVNAGDTRSEDTLQKALGVPVTGKIDPDTVAAAQNSDPSTLTNSLLNLRELFYRDLVAEKPHLGEFLNGWLNRVKALRQQIGA